jgi:hypothetical protein
MKLIVRNVLSPSVMNSLLGPVICTRQPKLDITDQTSHSYEKYIKLHVCTFKSLHSQTAKGTTNHSELNCNEHSQSYHLNFIINKTSVCYHCSRILEFCNKRNL